MYFRTRYEEGISKMQDSTLNRIVGDINLMANVIHKEDSINLLNKMKK